MTPRARVLLAFVATAIASTTCVRRVPDGTDAQPVPPDRSSAASGGDGAVTTPKPAKTAVRLASPEELSDGGGLVFRLTDGQRPDEASARARVADTTVLDDAATAKLLARLPPLAAAAGDVQDAALRPGSQPPPKTGAIVKEEFPPRVATDAQRPTVEAGPFRVLRAQPEGDVELAPELSVTFSEAMVAVTSQDEAAALKPVTLEPEPKGTWRWVGTKTILFRPDGRFPMATEYRATIAKGVKALSGAALATEKSWTFRTPPPKVTALIPQGGPVRLDPVFFVAFDQRIDPAKVLEKISVRAGSKTFTVVRASTEEALADAWIRSTVQNAEEGRWLAFRATEKLSPDTDVVVTIGPGTPSAEGPRTSAKAETFTVRTYGPMKVAGQRCGWSERCPPRQPWDVWFSNPIDADRFDPKTVRVSPEVAGLRVDVGGAGLSLRGLTKARTRYTVTLPASLPDVFGQTLGTDVKLTFDVGPSEPMLHASGDMLAVLDPSAPPVFSIHSTNYPRLIVRIHTVTPEQFPAFTDVMHASEDRGLPGKKVFDGTVQVKGEKDELVETRLELSKYLRGGTGHLVVDVRPPDADLPEPWMKQHPPRVRRWLQVTKLGLDAVVDADALTAWVTSLADGAPIANAEVSIAPHGLSARTAASGLATFELPSSPPPGGGLLVARVGEDSAFLPEMTWNYRGQSSWQKRPSSDALRWWVIDDRGLYRPGETAKLKGFLRRIPSGKGGDVGSVVGLVSEVSWALSDSRGNQIKKGLVKLTEQGGFDLSIDLPKDLNLGEAMVNLEVKPSKPLENANYGHFLGVQEFRRPEFEVSASVSEGPHLVGDRATATVQASYYAGGGLPSADVTWEVSATPTSFTPPNRGGFTFGAWVPWWGGGYSPRGKSRSRPFLPGRPEPAQSQSHFGQTGPTGAHDLAIELAGVSPPRATSLVAQATVMDVNRQAWTASTQLLVHPAAHYVGLRLAKSFFEAGEPISLDAIVVDLEGAAIPGRKIALRAARLDWKQEKGVWREEDVDETTLELASAKDPVNAKVTPKQGGRWKLRATITDDAGRANETELMVWVAGERQAPRRGVDEERVELVPDQREYSGGMKARILVRAPFAPAEALATVRRSGVIRTERFTMREPTHVLEVPIEEAWVPNVVVQVDVVGAAPRVDDEGNVVKDAPPRPAYASGAIELKIPAHARTLAVTAKPRAARLEPGGSTTIDVRVVDANKTPVAKAEVLVFVVDESVLALSSYRLKDPIEVFYSTRSADARDLHSRASLLLASLVDLPSDAPKPSPPGAMRNGRAREKRKAANDGDFEAQAVMMAPSEAKEMDGGGGGEAAPIAMRSNFDALALFAPVERTGSDGTLSVNVKLPDNLTRYRVMVVAAEDRRFGTGESSITARKPLMVRPSAPRFMNFGDELEFPVVVQNQTDAPIEVSVAMRTTNTDLVGAAGRRVTVPGDDRVEVRFPVRAAKPGTARYQVVTAAGTFSDAAEGSLPVWTPATTEAFATYGEVDRGAIAQVVRAPADVITTFGGLEVSASSTQLQALTDAVVHLVEYPYECSEQIASRVLAIAALKDVLDAFEAEGLPPPKEVLAAVARDLEKLRGMQNGDGGFGFWRRGDESWPFNSIHAAHALARAKEKRFAVNDDVVARVREYLRNIESNYPRYYSPEIRRTLTAYALYVRNLHDDRDLVRARSLITEAGGVEKMPLEALGWLYPVLSGDPGSATQLAAIRRLLNNRVTETAGTAHFATSYSDGAHFLLHSERRADGLLLAALIQDQPKSDLIPKLVRGLLAHRVKGRWSSTQDNVWVLLALDRYFQTYEKTPPAFVARVWLGDAFAGEHTFRGHTTETSELTVPMATVEKLAGGNGAPLTIQKDGTGRLYYRVGLRYAPKSLVLRPADHGFAVERRYEAIDDPADVARASDGTWKVRAGAKVRVRVTMVAPTRRYHVALVDPLPAGLEVMNPALAVTGSIPRDDAAGEAPWGWWWFRPWYEHQNLRDERVEAFTSLLWEGVHEYSYVARATTPGRFVVPPSKAEEMYAPETFGRSGSDVVVVEAR
ncbi:DUF6049 family protein [Myxococcota bacterium]|nr:DUF6049 family protein [Myxococcota bacterium]